MDKNGIGCHVIPLVVNNLDVVRLSQLEHAFVFECITDKNVRVVAAIHHQRDLLCLIS